MIILPAIDLMGGQVVRLRQGNAAEKTVYSDDPVGFAKKWEQEGGDWLHIVDLDASFSGASHNLDAVKKIAAAISIPCQLGGGMRSEEAIQAAFDSGVARIVIGTRACESMDFVASMVEKFGGDRIAVGIDARDGIVSVKGWTESSNIRATDLAKDAEKAGVGTIICTDIATDGMLTGPNFPVIENMLGLLRCKLIASGGVSRKEDVTQLGGLENLYGVIIGKALYDGTLHLRDLRNGSR